MVPCIKVGASASAAQVADEDGRAAMSEASSSTPLESFLQSLVQGSATSAMTCTLRADKAYTHCRPSSNASSPTTSQRNRLSRSDVSAALRWSSTSSSASSDEDEFARNFQHSQPPKALHHDDDEQGTEESLASVRDSASTTSDRNTSFGTPIMPTRRQSYDNCDLSTQLQIAASVLQSLEDLDVSEDFPFSFSHISSSSTQAATSYLSSPTSVIEAPIAPRRRPSCDGSLEEEKQDSSSFGGPFLQQRGAHSPLRGTSSGYRRGFTSRAA